MTSLHVDLSSGRTCGLLQSLLSLKTETKIV